MRRKRKIQKKSSFMKSVWAPLIIGPFLIMALLGIHYFIQKESQSGETDALTFEYPNGEEIKSVIRRVLEDHEVPWDEYRIDYWRVRVPADLPIPSLHLAIKEKIGHLGMRFLLAESEPVLRKVKLHIGCNDSCFLHLDLVKYGERTREQGKIAILIDDFGDRIDDFVKSFSELSVNITVSVLPGRKMSTKVAREMKRLGCEVTLHLPMEPLNSSYDKDDYIIETDMSRTKIRKIIQQSLDEIPGVVGVNNHMGSKVTSHRETITDVLIEIKMRDLYFIDSRTVASTVAYDVAKALGLRCGKRDVFLDVEEGEDSIRNRLWELTRKAKEKGFAIGIGHCQRRTLEVLRDEIPKIQAKGYQFVFLSEVVK